MSAVMFDPRVYCSSTCLFTMGITLLTRLFLRGQFNTTYWTFSCTFQENICIFRKISSRNTHCTTLVHKWKGKAVMASSSNNGAIASTSTGSGKESDVRESCNLIAAIQMTATENKSANLRQLQGFILEAVSQGAKMIFLPEAFDFIGRHQDEIQQLAEPIEGPTLDRFKALAKEHAVWLSLGGFHEKQNVIKNDGNAWITNDHIVINDQGELECVYKKLHLFDVVIPEEKVNLQESSYVLPGQEIFPPVTTPVGNVGLGICYDLRFPEFSTKLRKLGAHILTFPSAFTVPTGKAHWETLLRARAIENQCFVVAAAQVGQHNEKRTSYGHSMIIDPWGKILAEARNDENIIYASIDLEVMHKLRKKMPVAQHRRPDLYSHCSETENEISPVFVPQCDPNSSDFYPFGHVKVPKPVIFLENESAFASVNRKCILPGHVLVITKRPVDRLVHLTDKERKDLFDLAKWTQKVMEHIYKATSSTVSIQDGPDAGQTIKHVHVHILPRKPMDFDNNDNIYSALATHDKGEVQWRTDEDMTKECNQIKETIAENNLLDAE